MQVFVPSGRAESTLIKNTLAKDPTNTNNWPDTERKKFNSAQLLAEAAETHALRSIYALLRPGDAPNKETARQALERLFFSPKRYDLGRVGRYKINQRLGLSIDPGHDGAHQGRLRRHPPLSRGTARGTGARRRHRPSRQPPHPVGG